MATLSFTTVALGGDVTAALAALPKSSGVGQILGAEGRSLLIGRPANLRRWAGTHLGAGKPARKGKRPPTDLRPIAATVAYATTTSGFHQRLVFERLMARHVPLAKRRDLRPPVYLRLDPGERFPRVTIGPDAASAGDRAHVFGPFRDRRAAERALKALHKLFPLRPCDFVFEPHPALPLGLGCLYAQVQTCAAPCLVRVGEEAYRALARDAAFVLADPGARPPGATEWLPRWVATSDALGLVVERRKDALELYPVRGGSVVDDAAVTTTVADLSDAVSRLDWPQRGAADDRPWLMPWLQAPRRTGLFLVVGEPVEQQRLEALLRESLGEGCAE